MQTRRQLELVGPGAVRLAPFISHMGSERIECVDGGRYLLGKCPGQPALLVDITRLLARLGIDVSTLDVHLRTDRDILASGHRHRTCSNPGNTCGENGVRLCMARCHADHQARGGYEPVIGTQHPHEAIRRVPS